MTSMDTGLLPPNHMKWKLRVDHRERGSRLLELIGECKDFDTQIQTLQAGDYLVNDRIIVERKSHHDFALSIIDGRLFHQAAMLTRLPQRALVLVEGPKPEMIPRVHPNALKGAVLSLAVAWRLPVVFSRNPEESILLLQILAEQSQAIKGRNRIPFGSIHKHRVRRRIFVLQALPGVGQKLATRFLQEFGSVEKVMQADESKLEGVPGCGARKAAAIRAVLGSEQDSGD
ncbi:MAG: hypothetical protein HY644_12655 [Acidobacteria bacterium]|nr:hypothetical protein [Acidobacteriota bacterium]